MRQRQITLRLSDEEYDRLLDLARADPDCMTRKSSRPSLSSYIRKVLFYSGDHPENLKKEIRELVFQIKKAGVNINQAARWINAGYGSISELEKMEACQEKIQSLLEEILLLLKTGTREGA